ncbi:hypothetical protein MBLNU230_g2988t1 [Neophaeotheca triangularis]
MRFLSVAPLLASLLPFTTAAPYSNPLRTYDGGDPNIVYHDGYYYFISTTWDQIQMTRATTLNGLKNGTTKEVWSDTNPSRCCDVWAPEMHFVDNRWHIYYTAGTEGLDLDTQRSHVIEGGDSPWDDYSYLGQIGDDWAIDATVLYANNKRYLVYSGFGGGTGETNQSLIIAELLSPAVIGEPYLLSEPTQEWELSETPVNEGAAALYHAPTGRTWLSFAASFCWTPDYSLGLLEYDGCGDPLDRNSWTKTGPVFSSANGNFGTGHNSFFMSPDGTEVWSAYHSTPDPEGNCGSIRWSNALPVRFDAEGTPDFGEAPPANQTMRGPSGEPGEPWRGGWGGGKGNGHGKGGKGKGHHE